MNGLSDGSGAGSSRRSCGRPGSRRKSPCAPLVPQTPFAATVAPSGDQTTMPAPSPTVICRVSLPSARTVQA